MDPRSPPADETRTQIGESEESSGSPGTVYLTVLHHSAVRMVPLPPGECLVLGREAGVGLCLPDEGLSRRHAEFRRTGDRVVVTDLGSKNGTRVNGRRLAAARELRHGDQVRAGECSIAVVKVAPLGPARPPTLPARSEAAEEPGEVVVEDPCMKQVFEVCGRIAQAFTSVLVLGETGAGKEVIARHIHRASPFRDGPFVAINCSAIPESVAEAELFGHEKGAFTGATERRVGYLESAHGGTVFLDEVTDLALPIQAKLLRVLDNRRISRVGTTHEAELDVRFVCATNQDVEALLASGRLRRDLYYRLGQFLVYVPPLRARPADVPALAAVFARRIAGRLGRPAPRFEPETLDLLAAQPWPGNIRQLRNVVERAVVLAQGQRIAPGLLDAVFQDEHPGATPGAGSTPTPARIPTAAELAARSSLDHRMRSIEEKMLLDALDACDGNQTKAARLLGITRRAVIYRMAKYGIRPAGRDRAR
ncbi:MAG: sigma 54-interacting transcriptional regulator [Deltaproteobacteria bacterium]|nr:sigma 54-interacting transcriptional regulator [Deltaproteobacteria bacterium]